MTITLLKAVSVIIILAIMILILLSVNHLASKDFDASDADLDRMREDLEETDDVITDESVFRELVKVPRRSDTHNPHI